MRFLISFRDSAHVYVHACTKRNQCVGRSVSMAVKGSYGASWSDEEVIALITALGDSLLRTKPTHSRRPHSLRLHYEAEKIKRQHELFLVT